MTSPTQHALDKLTAARQRISSKAHQSVMAKVPHGIYDGAELRPCQDRPSAMQAHALPSRRGSFLRWPDGRLTDMQGNAASQDGNFVGTLPSFGTKIEAKEAKASIDKVVAMPIRYRARGSGLGGDRDTPPSAVLTSEKVAQIKQALRDKPDSLSKTALAKKLAQAHGVAATTIRGIFSGSTWKHVA